MAGQRVPPRIAPSRVLKSSLELCIAWPWQRRQFCSSIGWMSLLKDTGA
jgi:hypothetical protein